MRLFQFNPTIKETSKYLQETVDQLLKKHGSVSNPDFEKELIETTGIAYKQIKNYKNHPKPNQRIKDNAIVIKFVREKRKQNRLKIYAANGLKTVPLVIAAAAAWYLWPKAPPAPQKIYVINGTPVETPPPSMPQGNESELRISLKIPKLGWLLRLGEMAESKFDEKQFKCSAIFGTEQMRCKYGGGAPVSISYLKEGSIVQQISVSSYNSGAVSDLEEQVVAASKGLQEEPHEPGRTAKVYRSKHEVLMFEKSEWKSQSPPLKQITISLRLDI